MISTAGVHLAPALRSLASSMSRDQGREALGLRWR
jgi:hypothetical protein